MANNVRKLRLAKGWNLEAFAEKVNHVLDGNPHLRKITKKNPYGVVDYQTLQRLETGEISLNDRWVNILKIVFECSASDLSSTYEGEDTNLLKKDMQLFIKEIEAGDQVLKGMFDNMKTYLQSRKGGKK